MKSQRRTSYCVYTRKYKHKQESLLAGVYRNRSPDQSVHSLHPERRFPWPRCARTRTQEKPFRRLGVFLYALSSFSTAQQHPSLTLEREAGGEQRLSDHATNLSLSAGTSKKGGKVGSKPTASRTKENSKPPEHRRTQSITYHVANSRSHLTHAFSRKHAVPVCNSVQRVFSWGRNVFVRAGQFGTVGATLDGARAFCWRFLELELNTTAGLLLHIVLFSPHMHRHKADGNKTAKKPESIKSYRTTACFINNDMYVRVMLHVLSRSECTVCVIHTCANKPAINDLLITMAQLCFI